MKGFFLVCFQDEQPIGEILLLEEDDHTLEVKNIAIAEDRQGQGYGKQLIKRAKEFGAEQGYYRLIVGTCNSSFDELAFYQKQGFRFFGIKRDFFLLHYKEPIFENGIQCRDMMMLDLELNSPGSSNP